MSVVREELTEQELERPLAQDLDVVVVGGAGHVGLPLSLAFAATGSRVGVFDTSADSLARIEGGQMPFKEEGAEALLDDALRQDRLEFSASPEVVQRTSQVVIVIGTPIDEFLNPSFTVFDRLVAELAPHFREDALVVLRSTVYPGTAAHVTRTLRERGCQVHIAFCPERIAEGHALEELHTLPQIIGADEPEAATRAAALFSPLGANLIHTTTKEAELAKLLTNAWRYAKFAIANQFFMVAHAAGLDYERVLHAVRHDYPRAADLPSPGFAAGPCLLKDTMQLAAFTSDNFPLGHAAMLVNEGLPAYVVGAMEQRFGGLAGKTVGLLGMAFKAESDDPRGSLSYKLKKLLMWSGARVLCTDPYVRDDRLVPLERVLAESDILVVAAPHRAYKRLRIEDKQLVDIWGALGQGIVL
jgi:UDP-N-acetyl-D-mannosaminuronic acid dehydrogenase